MTVLMYIMGACGVAYFYGIVTAQHETDLYGNDDKAKGVVMIATAVFLAALVAMIAINIV